MNRKNIIQILTSLVVLACLLPAHAANVHVPPLIELLLLNPKIVSYTFITDDLHRDGGKEKYKFSTTDKNVCSLVIFFGEPHTTFLSKVEWVNQHNVSEYIENDVADLGLFGAVAIEKCFDIAGNNVFVYHFGAE